MAKAGGADQYANLACITVTESGANTLTFKKLETGISLFEKVAWILHRIEYDFSSLAANFNGDGDQVTCGVSCSEDWSTIAYTNPALLDLLTYQRADYGAAAVALFHTRPLYKDFTNLPGGGIITPPNPLYGWCKGTGLVSAITVTVRLYYTTKALSPEDYWELVEARRIISSS